MYKYLWAFSFAYAVSGGSEAELTEAVTVTVSGYSQAVREGFWLQVYYIIKLCSLLEHPSFLLHLLRDTYSLVCALCAVYLRQLTVHLSAPLRNRLGTTCLKRSSRTG